MLVGSSVRSSYSYLINGIIYIDESLHKKICTQRPQSFDAKEREVFVRKTLFGV